MVERDTSRDTSAPEPLASADCDLRGLPWMPVNTEDLLDSTLFLESTGEEFKAAWALICKSWRQVPAGSLPNSDKSLATLSGASDWTSVRTMALRNWVLCSDGRLYHPVVAAKAMEALPGRQEFVEKKNASAERKERERRDRKELFSKLRAAGIVLHYTTTTTELRERVAQLQDAPPAPAEPSDSSQAGHDLSRDMPRLGEGEGQGEGQLIQNPSGSVGAPAAPSPPAAPAKAGKKRRGDAAEPQPGELLEGPKQRSARAYRKCPDTFRLTGAMVTWANTEYPILDFEEVRKSTRAFMNHRFKTARIEWVPTWENWIKEEADRKASRARPAATFRTERQQRVAEAFPAVAAHRGPPPRPVTPPPQGKIEDVEPRSARTAIGR